jgi:hypothetical protein
MEKTDQEKTQWIDDFFDEKEDPVVTNFNLIGMIETLIDNSVFEHRTKKELHDKIETLKESEVSGLINLLKENRIIRDPRDQFDVMAKNGLFK